jgi:hypothetical protein
LRVTPLQGKRQETKMDPLACTLFIGAGATAIIDLWAVARRRLLGVPFPNYPHVGRWLAHMRHGRFRHAAIATATPEPLEALIGWTAHYLIGIAFAALLPALWGTAWLREPTLGPALLVGIGTVAAPYFVLQPGMGAGIAASRTPRPGAARLHSLVMHAIFGLGLYVAARLVQPLCAA